jgi:hypothetical protein
MMFCNSSNAENRSISVGDVLNQFDIEGIVTTKKLDVNMTIENNSYSDYVHSHTNGTCLWIMMSEDEVSIKQLDVQVTDVQLDIYDDFILKKYSYSLGILFSGVAICTAYYWVRQDKK